MTSDGKESRVLLVVTDGLGYAPERIRNMAEQVWGNLNPASRRAISLAVQQGFSDEEDIDAHLIELMMVVPRWIELVPLDATKATLTRIADFMSGCRHVDDTAGVSNELLQVWTDIGEAFHYVPWVAEVPDWSRVVNRNLTFPTLAAGIWVGYDDVDPPVQGNSETGHQQIGNLALAPQISLQISQSINDGAFYENPAINDAITQATTRGGNVNICFLFSGLTGSDGRVHSAWEHLEAMLELVFGRLKLPPRQVRLQAILDGRDAPAVGSLQLDGVEGGYLGELSRLLARFDAGESLAWIVGRSIAMDRDYREDCAQTNYALLTQGQGKHARGIDDVCDIVAEFHAQGGTDADVPPIVVHGDGCEPPTISSGDAFINLNFRSDRQRAITATLSNAKEYLHRESSARGRTWSMDWLRDDLPLSVCTIAEYDAEFAVRHGVQVAYQTRPHPLNFISAWDELVGDGSTYFLAAESVKASHMGYFLRGRREIPACVNSEVRWVIPSAATDAGVVSDSDYYKVPGMRTAEIVARVSDAMINESHRLMVCNLAAPDMVGHLLPKRWDAAIVAYRETCEALVTLSKVAAAEGVHMIVTSDHGNIEEYAPTHTANPVLTTINPANSEQRLEPAVEQIEARLFDIPHCLARLLHVDPDAVQRYIDSSGAAPANARFLGRSLIG